MNALEILKWHEFCKKFELNIEELLYLAAIKADKREILQDESIIKSLINKGFLTENRKLSQKNNPFTKAGTDYEKLSIEYRDMFPRIIIPTSGKPARSPISEILKKLKWFLENHDYEESVIVKAVLDYVTYCESRNYEYMQTSSYFIRKQDKDKMDHSSLAEWCERVLAEGTEVFGTDL